jgi:hypothetical protein
MHTGGIYLRENVSGNVVDHSPTTKTGVKNLGSYISVFVV